LAPNGSARYAPIKFRAAQAATTAQDQWRLTLKVITHLGFGQRMTPLNRISQISPSQQGLNRLGLNALHQ
jgi:hypothetical protein